MIKKVYHLFLLLIREDDQDVVECTNRIARPPVGNVARRYHISKYPTLKLIKFGQLAKREYRGQRSAEAFVTFVKDQIRDPVAEFKALDDLKTIEAKKRHVIGYYGSNDTPQFMEFKKLAMHLKDDCEFHVTFE